MKISEIISKTIYYELLAYDTIETIENIKNMMEYLKEGFDTDK